MGKRVSLHVNEQTLDDLMKFTGETSASKAIGKAVDALIQRERDARIEF